MNDRRVFADSAVVGGGTGLFADSQPETLCLPFAHEGIRAW
jgi:hypothetical protein